LGLERSLRAPLLTSDLETIFPATIIFLLALPHIWCTTFRNRGYPLPTPPNLKLLRDLITDADALYWDTQNEVLIFGTVK
jgi:hypothetical protein